MGRARAKLKQILFVIVTFELFSSVKYPASVTLDQLKRECPVFADKVCPFANLPEQHKGAAGNCPAFAKGCPLKSAGLWGSLKTNLV